MQVYRIFLIVVWVVVFSCFCPQLLQAQLLTSVSITGGPPNITTAAEKTISTVLHAVASKKEPSGSVMTSSGKSMLVDIWKKTKFTCSEASLNLQLIELVGGAFEVRQIPVKITTEDAVRTEELVLQLNNEGKIISARFAMEEQNMAAIFSDAIDIIDLERRQIILQFLELYRTAYNRKDVDYIEKTFSDNAIIIVGQVLKDAPKSDMNLDNSSISRENIKFIRYSKTEYIDRLRTATFKRNAFINVAFSDVNIVRHPRIEEIYGVSLKQRWNSSTYEDEGFLFLMIDFKNEKEPLIHVRSWQPEKFPDGSIVSLYDFPIIE